MNKTELRDFFAAIAMHVCLQTKEDEYWPLLVDPSGDDEEETICDEMARAAYWFADAMIKAREQ